jgi:hypothetical protein
VIFLDCMAIPFVESAKRLLLKRHEPDLLRSAQG